MYNRLVGTFFLRRRQMSFMDAMANVMGDTAPMLDKKKKSFPIPTGKPKPKGKGKPMPKSKSKGKPMPKGNGKPMPKGKSKPKGKKPVPPKNCK